MKFSCANHSCKYVYVFESLQNAYRFDSLERILKWIRSVSFSIRRFNEPQIRQWSNERRWFHMVVKGIFSYPFQYLDENVRCAPRLFSLPPYVDIKGPYIHIGSEGRVKQIINYEFEEAHYWEAWKCISRVFEELRDIRGCSYSITIIPGNNESH